MPQTLHPDFETTLPETDYFFLGNGKVELAVQWSRSEHNTPLGIILSDPARLGRKWSSLLFHPEYGLERTMITLIVDGVRRRIDRESLKVEWESDGGIPIIHAHWQAGNAIVHERFIAPWDLSLIRRAITIENCNSNDVQLEAALYANPAHFDRFSNTSDSLHADGYESIGITTPNHATPNERFIQITPRLLAGRWHAVLDYSIGPSENARTANPRDVERKYWNNVTALANTGGPGTQRLVDLFNASMAGLRAIVSDTGRFDASTWQYGFEWSGDASVLAEALIYCGQFEVARRVLVNILTQLSTEDGMVAESSRFRGGSTSELNNNGEVLKACHTYLVWTGDESLIREHFPRITAIADYLLRPEYVEPETGMLVATRDIWERNEWMGVKPGFDISHQTFGCLGLEAASKLATAMGDSIAAAFWLAAAERIKESMLHDPTHSMIENDRIIKRRLLDGSVQRSLAVDPSKDPQGLLKSFVASGTPLASGGDIGWEPDVSEVFPIVFGLVDGNSDVAKNTLNELEMLWSQQWEGGGYARYNVLSEPDSPGPWPFATAYMAAAQLEAGEYDRAWRTVQWLCDKAGAGGSWFEFYGDRPTPPLPPTGIIGWGWSQFITLVIRHILNVHVEGDELTANPRIDGLKAELRFRDRRILIG